MQKACKLEGIPERDRQQGFSGGAVVTLRPFMTYPIPSTSSTIILQAILRFYTLNGGRGDG